MRAALSCFSIYNLPESIPYFPVNDNEKTAAEKSGVSQCQILLRQSINYLFLTQIN